MISLLIYVLIVLIIFAVVFYIIDLIPFGTPNLKWALHALVGLILILVLLEMVLGHVPPAALLR